MLDFYWPPASNLRTRTRRSCRTTFWLITAVAVAHCLIVGSQSAQANETYRSQQEETGSEQSAEQGAALREAYQLSKEASTEEQYGRIIELCRDGLAGDSSRENEAYAKNLMSWAYNRRGELLSNQGLETEALADFESSVQLGPKRWQAVHNRGVSYAMQGDYEKAVADFDRTIRLQPSYATAYFNRGELRYEQGEFESAIRDYDQTIRLKPEDSVAHNSRGHAYYRRGNYRAAVDDYSAAIRHDPQNAAAYTNRGDAMADVGYFDRAAQDYRTAIDVDPDLGRAYQSAAWLMATCPDAEFRNPILAVQAARKSIELDGDADYRYLGTMAAAFANADQFDQAIQFQNKAITIVPEDKREHYQDQLSMYQRGEAYRHTARQVRRPGDENSARERRR